ncbi:hypothetical protein ACW2Q0_12280 [Nocardia sp. R16R-3T]
MPTTNRPTATRRCSALWGIGAGLVLAVFVFLPAVFVIRQWLDLPEIPATPAHLRARPIEVPASYWITWIIASTMLLAPAAVLALWPTTRRAAIGYALTAVLAGGSLLALTIGFELGGFAPS